MGCDVFQDADLARLLVHLHLDEVRGDEGLHHQNQINTIHKAGLFLKANSALAGAGEGVALRQCAKS